MAGLWSQFHILCILSFIYEISKIQHNETQSSCYKNTSIVALDLDQTVMKINMAHATIKKPSSYHKIKIVCTTGRPNTVIKNILS